MAKYTDIDLNFSKNELTNDVNLKYDTAAIAQSLKNITLTTPGEKLFDPFFGGRAYNLLFEDLSGVALELFKTTLYSSLSINEPRANIENIDILKDIENSTWSIKITFSTVTNPEQLRDINLTIGTEK